ncbi:hypothetical protein YC2023_018313 [Brassica napus]
MGKSSETIMTEEFSCLYLENRIKVLRLKKEFFISAFGYAYFSNLDLTVEDFWDVFSKVF